MHLFFLFLVQIDIIQESPIHVFKINQLKSPGIEKSKYKDSVLLKPKTQQAKKTRSTKQAQKQKQVIQKQNQKSLADFKDISSGQFSTPAQQLENNSRIRISGSQIPSYLNSSSISVSPLVGNDLMMNIQIPEGVPEDELNKIEQIYYSFRKRIFIQYVNSLISGVSDHNRISPLFRFPMTSEKKRLNVQAVFDSEGELISVRPLSKAKIAKLDNLFLQTIKNINRIPNIPPSLLNHNNQLVVQFGLILNEN
jgi:hypothetical protein